MYHFFTGSQKNKLWMFIIIILLSMVFPAIAQVNKPIINKLQIDKKKAAPRAPGVKPAVSPSKVPGVVHKSLEIAWFKVSKTRFASASLSMSGSSSGSPSGNNSTLDAGFNEQLYFGWKIQGSGMDPNDLILRFNARDITDSSRIRELPNNRFQITGTISTRAGYNTYTLSVEQASGRKVTKTVRINLLRSKFELMLPVVDQNRLKITIKGKNSGQADYIRNDTMVVHCVIKQASNPMNIISEQDFRLRKFTIDPGGQMILGEITLPSPALAFASNAIRIFVDVDHGLHSKDWHWTWAKKSITIDSADFRLLGMATKINIRINNWDGSVNPPYKADDSSILFDLPPAHENIEFDMPSFTHTIGAEEYQVFLRNITCRHRGDRDLFYIENGKICIGLFFPNSGSRQIKRGRIKKANPNKGKWQDNLATDVDLRPFTIKAYITPVIVDNKITYNEVEIDTSDISVRTSGSYPGIPVLRRYLARVVSRNIRNEIRPLLQGSQVKTAITNAINNALMAPGTEINRIVNLEVREDSIVVQYL